MRNFDGIIFDIDGTLTATNELIFASFNHITKKYWDKTLTDEEITAYFGPTEDVIIDELFGENAEKAKDEYYKFYYNNHHMAELYEGIKDLLVYIKAREIPLGIFTGKGKKSSLITLKFLSIDDLFDLIITGDDVKNHKPSAEGIEKFVNKFKLKPKRALMIGDSIVDIKASREAGVKIASVLWDSYHKEKVLKMNSDFIFNTVEELTAFIKDNI